MKYNLAQSFRDLTLIKLDEEQVLVIACDSLGGIGPKESDVIKVPGEIVGRFTTRVPLMEVLATGAHPIAVINNLCVEMHPTGAAIILGIKNELADAGLSEEIMLSGSTEENVQTIQTGMGITVLARAREKELRLGNSKLGSLIVCVGIPKVGQEVINGKDIVNISILKKILNIEAVQEILPVGSKGIQYEAEQLAKGVQGKLKLIPNQTIDLYKSAGPATCVLVSIAEKELSSLIAQIDIPISKIGYIQNRDGS